MQMMYRTALLSFPMTGNAVDLLTSASSHAQVQHTFRGVLTVTMSLGDRKFLAPLHLWDYHHM